MPIAEYFPSQGLQNPAKVPYPYEDLPLTAAPLSDFVVYRKENDANWSHYFLLTELGGTNPQNAAPAGSVAPLLNVLHISNEEFGDYGPNKTRYLYAIDDAGIHVGKERCATIAKRQGLTHTNLCSQAYFAGEVFFVEPTRLILSPNSGRFGFSPGANPDG